MIAEARRFKRGERVKILPVYQTEKQVEFRNNPAWVRGFVAGRGSGKTVVGAKDVLLRAEDGQPWMSVSPSYGIIHETTLPTFCAEARRLGRFIRVVKSPLPRVTFYTSDGGTGDIVFRSGDDPEKLRGPSKAGLWIDEASICNIKVFELGMAVLRHEMHMGPLILTFTPRGRKHWTFDVFYERCEVRPDLGEYIEDDEETGESWYCYPNPEEPETIHKRPVHWFGGLAYCRKANSHLVHAHTLDNPFLPEEFHDNIAQYYSSQLARQELAGEFVDIEGLMFKRSWFETVYEVPRVAARVRYWDRAGTPDGGNYSAGTLMARDERGVYYIEDVVRGQWSPFERDNVIEQVAKRDAAMYNNEVIIYIEQEGGSGGMEVAQQIVVRLAGHPVYRDVVSGIRYKMRDHSRLPGDAKVVRAHPFAAAAERGDVRMKLGAWNVEYMEEITAFPDYAFDDMVDASSGAFNKVTSHTQYVAGKYHRTTVGAKDVAAKYGTDFQKSKRKRRTKEPGVNAAGKQRDAGSNSGNGRQRRRRRRDT